MSSVKLPLVYNIERVRGDTRRVSFKFTDPITGDPIDISTWTQFTLTVDPEENPVNADNNIASTGGGLTTDGTDGRCFLLIDGTIDIGDYYFDGQCLDNNSEKLTFVKGRYTVPQDISKT